MGQAFSRSHSFAWPVSGTRRHVAGAACHQHDVDLAGRRNRQISAIGVCCLSIKTNVRKKEWRLLVSVETSDRMPMNEVLFGELLASVREGGAILRRD
jgi:hypothetical protein